MLVYDMWDDEDDISERKKETVKNLILTLFINSLVKAKFSRA
jgi:hypothetical protein